MIATKLAGLVPALTLAAASLAPPALPRPPARPSGVQPDIQPEIPSTLLHYIAPASGPKPAAPPGSAGPQGPALPAAPSRASGLAGDRPEHTAGFGHWTVEAVLTVPEIRQVALSADGRQVAYIVRTVDIAADRPDFALHLFDIARRTDRILIRSRWIDAVRPIPGTARWSVLADLGQGVQLYQSDATGGLVPLVRNDDLALVGSVDGAEYGFTETMPLRFGVISYDWSPDGQRLLYATLATSNTPHVLHDEAVVAASARRRWAPQGEVRFFVRSDGRVNGPVLARPASDRVARFMGGLPHWGTDHVDLAVQANDKGDPAVGYYRWGFGTLTAVPVPGAPRGSVFEAPTGPAGGHLAVEWRDGERHLVEYAGDGAMRDYDKTSIALPDPRAPGDWRDPRGAFVLAAVRLPEEARYALARIGRDGRTRLIRAPGSLTHCAFATDAEHGVCIEEGLTRPPRLVRVDARNGRIALLRKLDEVHEAIAPLRVEPTSWTNSFGTRSNGFVVYPREFRAGRRYPAIVVTHGSDADERFVAADLQWSYPIQVFAERGYFVLLVNAPSATLDQRVDAAYRAWNSCDGSFLPDDLQKAIWRNGVDSFATLIGDLTTEGLLDPAHVGIAGYSAGSQMVNVALTQGDLFRAGSSGDGAYLEPASYRYNRCGYRAIYGGAPGMPAAWPHYRALAPSWRAGSGSGALLQQLAEPRPGAVDLHLALSDAGRVSALTLYPGETPAADETHMLHIPSNRRAAMEENLDWFDTWLRDMPSSEAIDPARVGQWRAEAADRQSKEAVSIKP